MTAFEQVESHVLRIARSKEKKVSLPEDLAQRVASIYAKSLLDNKEYTSTRGKYHLDPRAEEEIHDIAKCLQWMLRWMTDPKRHHRQEASKFADKTIKGIKRNAINREMIVRRCVEFKRRRAEAIRHENDTKPWSNDLRIAAELYSAYRVNNKRLLNRVGHKWQNCLANTVYAKIYIRTLQDLEKDLIAVEDKFGNPCFLILYDLKTRTACEIKGPVNSCPTRYRSAIVSILKYLKVKLGSVTELANRGGFC